MTDGLPAARCGAGSGDGLLAAAVSDAAGGAGAAGRDGAGAGRSPALFLDLSLENMFACRAPLQGDVAGQVRDIGLYGRSIMSRPVTGNQNWQCIVSTGSGKIKAAVEMSGTHLPSGNIACSGGR